MSCGTVAVSCRKNYFIRNEDKSESLFTGIVVSEGTSVTYLRAPFTARYLATSVLIRDADGVRYTIDTNKIKQNRDTLKALLAECNCCSDSDNVGNSNYEVPNPAALPTIAAEGDIAIINDIGGGVNGIAIHNGVSWGTPIALGGDMDTDTDTRLGNFRLVGTELTYDVINVFTNAVISTVSTGIIIGDVVTEINGTIVGHKIGTYTNEDSVAVDINETITELVQTVTSGQILATYTNEDGADVEIFAPNDVVTTVANTISGHKIGDYTNEAAASIDINETVTAVTQIVTAGDLLATYTDENGADTEIYAPKDVITAITDTFAGHLIATYTNEDNSDFKINETVTSIERVGNNLEYIDEAGDKTTIEILPAVTKMYDSDALAAAAGIGLLTPYWVGSDHEEGALHGTLKLRTV